MKVKKRGKTMKIKFSQPEGKRVAEHVMNGGSLGDICVPVIHQRADADLNVPLEIKAGSSSAARSARHNL